MKSITTTAILAMGCLSAELAEGDVLSQTKHQKSVGYSYLKMAGQYGVCPGLGVGYRWHDMHGFNADFAAYSYWGAGFSLYGKAHYLLYPKQGHFYLGGGVGCIGGEIVIGIMGSASKSPFVFPTVEGIIGWEWKSQKAANFLQLEVGGIVGDSYILPIPILSFGIGF